MIRKCKLVALSFPGDLRLFRFFVRAPWEWAPVLRPGCGARPGNGAGVVCADQ
jgi:hypothetical protein